MHTPSRPALQRLLRRPLALPLLRALTTSTQADQSICPTPIIPKCHDRHLRRPVSLYESWNTLLRAHIIAGDGRTARNMVDQMRAEAIPITARSSSLFVRNILRERRPGRRPVMLHGYDGDDLGDAVSFMVGIIRSGGILSPDKWKEILLRLGQTGRYNEVERLALWLVEFLGPFNADNTNSRTIPARLAQTARWNTRHTSFMPKSPATSDPTHPLRIIFSTAFQKALVEWPFITSSLKPENIPTTALTASEETSHPRSKPWTRGLRLLKALRQRGVFVQNSAIRKAYHQRLMILFGPGQSKKLINRVRRAENETPLETMLDDARLIWGETMLAGLPLPLLSQVTNPRRLEILVLDRPGMRLDMTAAPGPASLTGASDLAGDCNDFMASHEER